VGEVVKYTEGNYLKELTCNMWAESIEYGGSWPRILSPRETDGLL
jgi:hypothetical protein